MSTKLEDFIRENKRAFDTDRPSSGLWKKIEEELEKKRTAEKKNIKGFLMYSYGLEWQHH